MKALQPRFKKNGFFHSQSIRVGNIAVFQRWKGKELPHFETIVIGSHDGYELAGVKIAPAETYPSSSAWGSQGWTFNNRESAIRKMDALLK